MARVYGVGGRGNGSLRGYQDVFRSDRGRQGRGMQDGAPFPSPANVQPNDLLKSALLDQAIQRVSHPS